MNEIVWAFDLGKASIGEAVRQGNEFRHKASLLISTDSSKNKPGARETRAGFVLETLLIRCVTPCVQGNGLRYLTLS